MKQNKRWFYAIVGVVILLLAGMVVLLQRRYRLYQERKGEERA